MEKHKNNNWNFNVKTKQHNFKSVIPNEVKQKLGIQNKSNYWEYSKGVNK